MYTSWYYIQSLFHNSEKSSKGYVMKALEMAIYLTNTTQKQLGEYEPNFKYFSYLSFLMSTLQPLNVASDYMF